MVNPDEIIAALRVLARVERTDMVRLIQDERWPIPIRRRDSARNMIGLALDHVAGQTAFGFLPAPDPEPHLTPEGKRR
jgi:hypothetical protein